MIGIAFLSASTQNAEQLNGNLRGAIVMGDIESVRALISAGADVNHRFKMGSSKDLTPLFLAVQLGHADICELIIDVGALVNAEIKAIGKGATLMHVAAASPAGNKAVINLLVAHGLDVNSKRKNLRAPAWLAVMKGTVEALDALIENGADVNVTYQSNFGIWTSPLHEAVLNNSKEKVALLIKGGAKVNALTSTGETPLDQAINNRRTEITAMLRENGATTNREKK